MDDLRAEIARLEAENEALSAGILEKHRAIFDDVIVKNTQLKQTFTSLITKNNALKRRNAELMFENKRLLSRPGVDRSAHTFVILKNELFNTTRHYHALLDLASGASKT